ncbi:MAG: LexA family transcriptional regulator [Legionellaceae bacterium]|nr:LexA family transcriptional regulator [Legionellaceae bacterium]
MATEQLKLDEVQRCTIAENLRYLMQHKKTTETKVAQDLNIPVMTVRRLLSGETTDPRVFTLKTIADYFNVSVDTLIDAGAAASSKFIGQSTPLFIPVFDWEAARNRNNIDLKKWQNWIPVTIGKDEKISGRSFALESRPSMYPRFQQGSIFIFDPDLTPSDGDFVLVNLRENNELTLRELFIDPPEWQLHPVIQGAPILSFSKEEHEIIAVVFLTLFYNRKTRPLQAEV